VGDTSNWEFAAVVAAVTMGLGGLLIFTLVSIFGAWRVFRLANDAARESAASAIAVRELARGMAPRMQAGGALDLRQTAEELSDLREQADALVEQQTRLQDAVRNLVEAGVLRGEGSTAQLEELEHAVRRLEDNLGQVATAVANLGQRMP
jgi:3-oxoacyl-(acyl-carrier-protein) synthase